MRSKREGQYLQALGWLTAGAKGGLVLADSTRSNRALLSEGSG